MGWNIRRLAPMIGAVLLWSALAVSGVETIGTLNFEQSGGEPVVEDLLRFNVRQQPGADYDRAQVDNDIKRLYDMGYFSDVVAELQPLSDGKLALKYRLKLRPAVTAVIFDGNRKFKTEELSPLVSLGIGAPLNDKALRDGANALREFYRGKGYLDAEVAPELEPGENNTVKVLFRIRENLKYRTNDVTFSGNTVFTSWKLRHSLATRYSYLSWVPYLDMGLFDREALNIDKVRLRDMYWNLGYLDFKIEKVIVTPDESDPEYVNIHFDLYEGEPYVINSIKVEGAKSFADAELLELVGSTPGQVFDYRRELGDKNHLLSLLHSEGYADASCQVKRVPDFKKHEVGLIYDLSEGRQYRINQVMIVGNEFTKDKVIRRELVIFPDDPADANLLDVSKSRLLGMDMFESVDVSMVNANQFNQKDVVVKVKEKDAYDLRVGAGFSDVDSLFGVIEASSRNFDITNPSNYFRGGGQRVRLQAAFGIERAALNLDFTEPWLFDLPLRLDVSAYMRQSIYEYWTEDRFGARVGLTRKFFDDFTSATIGYKIEQVNVRKMDHDLSQSTRDQAGRQWVSQFSLVLDRNTLDSMTAPTEGYQVNLLGAISPKILGSTEDFYRGELKAFYAKSFLEKALIWNLGGRIGLVDGFNSKPAPIFERYFLGGGDSLRGFPFRDVSPLDSSGHPEGGQSMVLFTTEMSHPIWDFIRGAIFVDAGGVSASELGFGFSEFNVGAGYGLRIKIPQVPVPIKLDLAYPVLNNQDNVKSRLRFHFNMGFSF